MGWYERFEKLAQRTGLRKSVTFLFYQGSAALFPEAEWTFMNLGYAPLSDADRDGGPERYCMSLYRHVAGAIDLSGARVLEVGCGRGGGSAFVMSQLCPTSVVGLDFAPRNVSLCQRLHKLPGLSFVVGDAEALPFPDGAFDVVLNVESSCLYASMDAFLACVRRVLHPGGHFLFADIRHTEDMVALDAALVAAGFTMQKRTDITGNVARALQEDSDRRVSEITRRASRPFHYWAKEIAGAEGSTVLRDLLEGSQRYISCVMAKPA
jgi:ubiquinone/menaquinone biosynthesis C-methylase UbiE